jgi:hypothetical protein
MRVFNSKAGARTKIVKKHQDFELRSYRLGKGYQLPLRRELVDECTARMSVSRIRFLSSRRGKQPSKVDSASLEHDPQRRKQCREMLP